MEEILNNIEQYILVIGPALVSIISMIATVVTAVKKVKESASSTIKETKVIAKQVASTTKTGTILMEKACQLDSMVSEKLNQGMDAINAQIAKMNVAMDEYKEIVASQKKEIESLNRKLSCLKAESTSAKRGE